MENTVACALCGLVCSMQVSASHLRVAHQMTTKDYRALGHQTLSPARLAQLRAGPVGNGEERGARGKFGKDHPNWKGGHVARNGYRIVSKRGKSHLYEHRVVAEEMLGRPLAQNEVVHHRDGNRSNNSPDNLVVMTRQEHDKIKDKTRQRFHTGPDCEAAAKLLRGHGWSVSKIARAIRVEDHTIQNWLKKP